MFYNSSKIIGRSTELVGVLFKELRLKLIIGSTILLAIVASATLTGVAQAQNENDLPAVGFSSANYEANEGYGKVEVTLRTSRHGIDIVRETSERPSATLLEAVLTNAPGGAPETLVLDLAVRAATVNDGGTAADVIFLELTEAETLNVITSITLDVGQTSQEFFVAVLDDDEVEFDETVNIYIDTVNGTPITDNGVDITIPSNDDTQATLTVEDGREGGTTYATIDLGGRTLSDAIPYGALKLVLADGSTMNADVEIVATDIVAGLKEASTVNVPIILKADDLVEGDETVVLELRVDSTIAPGLEDLLSVGTGSFTLADGPVTISLDAPDEVFEGDGARYLTARLSGPLAYPVTVFLDAGPDSTARLADDYFFRFVGVPIEPGQVTARFLFGAYSDNVPEGDEYLELVPRVNIGGMEVIGLSRVITIKNIVPPPPILSIANDPFEVQEGAIYGIDPQLDTPLTEDLTVFIRVVSSGTAREGEDFEVLNPEGLVIRSGSTTLLDADTLDVNIFSDSIYEGDEYIVLELTTDNPAVRTPSRITLTIKDFQIQPTISLDVPDEVFEGDGAHYLTARLSGPLAYPVTVFLDAGPDSTARLADDYFFRFVGVSIEPGQVTARFPFGAYSDNVPEGDEYLELVPGVNIGGMEVIGLSRVITIKNTVPPPPILSIANDPSPPILSITNDPFEVQEGAIYGIDPQLDTPLTEDLTVFIRVVSSGTAREGEDFEVLNPEGLVIRSGSTTLLDADTLDVNIFSDSIYEGDEYIVLELTTDNPAVRTPSRITLTIKDFQIQPTISLDVPDEVFEGDGARYLTATLSGPLAYPVTVFLDAGPDSTARRADDYYLSLDGVTIEPGQVTAPFLFGAYSDNVPEGDEYLELVPGVNIGGSEVTGLRRTITIKNTVPPPPILSIANDQFEVREGAIYGIDAELDIPLTEDLTVFIRVVSSGTAREDEDFEVLNPEGMVIPAGSTTLLDADTLDVRVFYDSIYEGDEYIVLELTTDNPAVRTPSRITLTIKDVRISRRSHWIL